MKKSLLSLLILISPCALLSQTAVSDYKSDDIISFNNNLRPKKHISLFKADDNSSNVLSKGKSTINIYYGYNVFTSIYTAVATSAALGTTVKSVGPVGVVYEYMISDKIGLGGEVGYSKTSVSYNETFTDYMGNSSTYNYQWNFSTIRAMVRLNIHFFQNDKFDIYYLTSMGYRATSFSFSTNEPNYGASVSFKSPIPFGIKPGLGFRFFFTKNIGLNLEMAIGTPIIGGGLSFKF
jgi:hypothetical protein